MPDQPSVLGVLRRNPAFVRLWLAQVVSMAGDWFNRMALLVLIGDLAGPEARLGVGLLYGLEVAQRLMPLALLSPLAGPLADRVPRRLLMVSSDLARAAVVLAYLTVDSADELPLLYTLLFLQMGLSMIFDAARTASLPDLVSREDIHTAHALSSATWSTMLTLGAAVGGALTAWLGPAAVFAADAGTYLVSAVLLIGLRLPAPPVHPEPFRWRDVLTGLELRRGLAHVRERRVLPAVTAKLFWWPAGGYMTLLAVSGQVRFGEAVGAAAATSTLYALRGLGTGVGPLLGRHWLGSSDRALRVQISLGFAVAALFYALFGPTTSLAMAATWVGLAHMGGSTIWVGSGALWQKHVDSAFRGRVHALDFLGMCLGFSVGALATGWFYDRTGDLALTTWLLSGLLVVDGLLWWRWSGRALPAEND